MTTAVQRVLDAVLALTSALGFPWQGAPLRLDDDKLVDIVFGCEVFYLADGGYSRVAVDMETRAVHLVRGACCDPTEDVLERWPAVQAERDELAAACDAWAREQLVQLDD